MLLPLGYILLILFVTLVNAFVLDESIEVNNKANAEKSAPGLLYSRTDATGLNGMVVGVGSQIFHEKLDLNAGSSVYTSSYNLTSHSNNSNLQNIDKPMGIGGKYGIINYVVPNTNAIHQNRYAISMNSLNGLSHFIDIRTDNNIKAVNAIVHDGTENKVSTSYNFETNGGEIAEGITNMEGQRHPQYIVERRVVGTARIRSNLTDSESKQFVSDQALMLDKIGAVNLAGETGHISFIIPSNNILVESADGDLNVNISSNDSVHVSGVGLPGGGYSIGLKESALSRAKVQQPVPTAQNALAEEATENISSVITVRGVSFIIPNDNLSANENDSARVSSEITVGNVPFMIPNDNLAANESNNSTTQSLAGVEIFPHANDSARNPPESPASILSIMSTGDSSPATVNACPYMGSEENNTTLSSQPLQGASLAQNANSNASLTSSNTTKENRTIDFGDVTFIIADSDYPEVKERVKQYVNLSTVEVGPPCTIKIGHGMGGSQ